MLMSFFSINLSHDESHTLISLVCLFIMVIDYIILQPKNDVSTIGLILNRKLSYKRHGIVNIN